MDSDQLKVKSTMTIKADGLLRLLPAVVPATAKNVRVTFEVPRGGDYSGFTFNLADVDSPPITISWDE
jgi:hypothetical protein